MLDEWITPDDHHPHVDKWLPVGRAKELGEWLKYNTKGAFIIRNRMQEWRGPHGYKEEYYRFFFTDDRDFILFKMFFS